MSDNVEKPRAKPGTSCPLWHKDVSKVCHACPWWTCVRGKHPQSEEIIDNWGCAINWLPMLLVENSQMQRQTGIAIDDFKNEVARAAEEQTRARVQMVREALRDMTPATGRLIDGRHHRGS